MVIDIGTASVSAVFATSTRDADELKTRFNIGTVFHQTFNLLTFSHGVPEARAWHVVNTALSKTFADAAAAHIHPRMIKISFASLFFKEYTVQETITRANPDRPITRAELDGIREVCKQKVAEGKDMEMIQWRVLHEAVNGYSVADAAGYTGETLRCSFQFLFISRLLYAHIQELLERYFPSVSVTFFSDADVLVSLVEHTPATLPSLIIDIGGEATSCYMLHADRGIIYHMPVYFGVRTLERRIATSIRIDIDEAASLLHRFTAGTLHENEWEKIQPIVESAIKDWWSALTKEISADHIASVVVAGAGRDMVFFTDMIKKQAYDVFSIQAEHVLPLMVPNDQCIPQKVFDFGGDVVLGGLLLVDG